MTLSIDFPPQTEAWIDEQARQRGLTPADVVRRLVEAQAASATPQPLSPQERIAILAELAEMNRDRPALPPEAFDRENLYDERV